MVPFSFFLIFIHMVRVLIDVDMRYMQRRVLLVQRFLPASSLSVWFDEGVPVSGSRAHHRRISLVRG